MTVKEYKKRLWDNLRVARRNIEISQIVAGERIGKAKSTVLYTNKYQNMYAVFQFLKTR